MTGIDIAMEHAFASLVEEAGPLSDHAISCVAAVAAAGQRQGARTGLEAAAALVELLAERHRRLKPAALAHSIRSMKDELEALQ
ncbi:hypothetical protein QNM97_13960 [Gordonia sp. L191]|uniref:hypothetical protein n=1 Tax=Gordonia sp. L191 TaxID=2982699 RepID=UPI0024BF4F4C|nr:hypothetical protein [Gordonia sp. L191]WHU45157.1 hypothetical protein QNM97_13960 [Gordonia sp. L191]